MKRRQLLRYLQGGGLAVMGTLLTKVGGSRAASPLTIQWLGHMCFLFTGSGRRVLVDPFKPIGCTAGYRPPKPLADVVLISSQLLDEGYVTGLPGNPQVLYQPGVFRAGGIQFQGISMDHDLNQGYQFGVNVAWKWSMEGINILDLGGAAAPITIDQQILMGRPDVLLVPVGGGPKAYDPPQAIQAIETLKPRIVIPTQYWTQAADPSQCDLVTLQNFLTLLNKHQAVQTLPGDTLVLTPQALPTKGTRVEVFTYNF